MDKLITYADNPGDDAPFLYAAARAHRKWCQKHDLGDDLITRMEVDPDSRTYKIYGGEGEGHELPPGDTGGSMDRLIEMEMAG